MNEQAIIDAAQQALSKNGMGDVPVKMTSARRYIGKAVAEILPDGGSQPKELRLSRRIMRHLSESEIMDTILHEVAHFIAGVENGHNDAWKQACVSLGANPKRTADVGKEVREATSKYRMTCQECGHDHYMNRRPKYDVSVYRCGVCNGSIGPLVVLDG